MELARVYDNLTMEDCYRKETLMAYLRIVEDQCSDTRGQLKKIILERKCMQCRQIMQITDNAEAHNYVFSIIFLI